MSGKNSNNEKESVFTGLLVDSKPNEAKYIIRFASGNFKINCGEKFIQLGLARAFFLHFQDKSDSTVSYYF